MEPNKQSFVMSKVYITGFLPYLKTHLHELFWNCWSDYLKVCHLSPNVLNNNSPLMTIISRSFLINPLTSLMICIVLLHIAFTSRLYQPTYRILISFLDSNENVSLPLCIVRRRWSA